MSLMYKKNLGFMVVEECVFRLRRGWIRLMISDHLAFDKFIQLFANMIIMSNI